MKKFVIQRQKLCILSCTDDYANRDINAPRHYLFENKEYVKIKTVSNCKSFARRKSEFARISWLDVVHSTFLKYPNEDWIYTLAPGITIEFGDHIQLFRMQRARLYTLRKLAFIWERHIQYTYSSYIPFNNGHRRNKIIFKINADW